MKINCSGTSCLSSSFCSSFNAELAYLDKGNDDDNDDDDDDNDNNNNGIVI